VARAGTLVWSRTRPDPDRRTETRLRRHAVWLLVVVCYVYPFPYFKKINNPNENVRIWATRAIAEFHQLDIRPVTDQWGPVDDMAKAGDRLVSSKAPGATWLGVPVYAAYRAVARALDLRPPSEATATRVLRLGGVAAPMAAFLFFFARWVERETGSARARDLLVLGLGVGSPIYPYGVIFAGHVHGAALAFVSFALLARGARGSRGPPRGTRPATFAAGLCAGFAVVFEYQLAVVLLIFGGWTLARGGRRAVWFTAGALPAMVLLAVYHTVLFGRPWAFPYGHLANAVYAEEHHGHGFFGLVLPEPTACWSLLFSVRRGLFAFSPVLALGLWGTVRSIGRARRGPALTVLVTTVVMFAFQAGMTNWRAGWSVGPRYIVVLAPLLAGAAAWCWRWPRYAALAPIAGGLVAASVFLSGLSGVMFPHYPESYSNPVFDLTVPLLLEGHAPYNIGRGLGLAGAWSLAPLAVVVGTAFLLGMGVFVRSPARPPLRRTIGGLALSAAVAGGFLFFLSLRFRHQEDETGANGYIESIWEPNP